MLPRMLSVALTVLLLSAAPAARALDEPWISDTFFYWYQWDYQKELGSWINGVHNTPLGGYYNSLSYKDNRRSLWQASEWGITHHFMDYWAPTWKDENGEMREKTVMRAAESLRKDGYNIWMSYYQDGTNFEMKDFSKNVSEKRDVYQWIRDFAKSPVWPRLNGYPLQLVYGRNGRPETSEDHEGFRRFLRSKYPTIESLNREWGGAFKSFDDIEMSFSASGFHRALSIKHQYEIWRAEWARLDDLVKKEFGLPGIRASFDVAYKPFLGFGYSDFARVFAGPHSYGGIFAEPHDQDVERFIQAAVARKYNTVFFDHFKNGYHDWNIRIPGIVYWPDPFNFDRFWVGALMRRSEALLHLSWNEWWEGSNLEPCEEFGKTHCQKNLFYSTLMQFCFPSIRQPTGGAEVVVLLNDWCFLAGDGRPDDLYETIQALRRLNVTFDLLPDDFVSDEALAGARIVIAPQCQTGLGVNAKGERLLDVLARWLKSGKGRRLVASRNSHAREVFGLRLAARPAAPVAQKGPDLNVFVDVGSEGDDQFLVDGAAGREDWKNLPKEQFGAGAKITVRWTPGGGKRTVFSLPASPGRDHVLRLAGNAIWPNTIVVRIEGREAGALTIQPGYKQYEVAIPAAALDGAGLIELALEYQETRVPKKMDPQRFPNESRVCNLALDWLQFATAGVPAASREQKFVMPKSEIEWVSDILAPLRGRRIECPVSRHDRLDVPAADIVSRYPSDGAPRDVVKTLGSNGLFYVNGLLSDVKHLDWWTAVLERWGGVAVRPLAAVTPPNPEDLALMSARLSAGDTDIVLAANYDISKSRKVLLSVQARPVPLSEVLILSRDGKRAEPLIPQVDGQLIRASDSLRYYGVYQFAFAPVRVSAPAFVLQPGEKREFKLVVRNLTTKPVAGAIRPRSVIPTLVGAPCAVSLEASQEREFAVTIEAKSEGDWGVKTVALELDFDGRKAYLFRDVTVLAPPKLRVAPRIVPAGKAVVEIQNIPERLMTSGEAEDVKLRVSAAAPKLGPVPAPVPRAAKTASLGTLGSGQKARTDLGDFAAAGRTPAVEPVDISIEYKAGGHPAQRVEQSVLVAHLPKEFDSFPGGLGTVTVFNPRSICTGHALVRCNLKTLGAPEKKISLRDSAGAAVPLQIQDSGEAVFPVLTPPGSGQTFTLCEGGDPQPASDLRIREEALGTRKGKLTVGNSFFTITLDEAKGGTVTEFRSAATGRDYAAESLGVTYGTFGKYDPTTPFSNTVKFISESRTRQSSSPAKITLLSSGPVLAVAAVEWRDRNLSVTQTYELGAYQRHFLLRQVVKPIPALKVQEIVALDARLVPHALSKIYPNFVGLPPSKEESPHYGWRYGNWIPDYLTFMETTGFEESISLVPLRWEGLDQVRQGFWPAQRPKPGPRALAEVEFISHKTAPISLDVCVVLHSGHQIVAKQFKEDMNNPLLVLPAFSPRWREGSIRRLVPPRADWFDVFWHYRIPLTVSATGDAPAFATLKLDLQALSPGLEVDPNSLRLVSRQDASGAWAFVPFAFDSKRAELRWRTASVVGKPAHRIFLYFDSVRNGPKPPAQWAPVGRTAISADDPIRSPEEWSLQLASLGAREGPDGRDAVKMLCPPDQAFSLISNSALDVLPRTKYKVAFWACAAKEPVALHTNLYHGADYDFIHGKIQVSGGDWKPYEVTVEARDFPRGIRPVFRLWTTEKNKEVLVSRLSVEPILPAGEVKVEMGKLESNCEP